MTKQLYRVYEQQEVGGKYLTGLPLDVAQELFDNMVEAGYDPLMVQENNNDTMTTQEDN